MKEKYENKEYENIKEIVREKIKNLFLNIDDEEFVISSIMNESLNLFLYS